MLTKPSKCANAKNCKLRKKPINISLVFLELFSNIARNFGRPFFLAILKTFTSYKGARNIYNLEKAFITV